MLQKFDERNRNLVVNVSGRLLARDEAGVSPFDSVVQGGDAVWEGLRLYRGRIFRLEQHLDRLVHSAKALAFAEIPSRETIVNEIRRTLDANGMYDGVHIRLTLTRGVKVTSGMDPRLNQSGPTLIVLAEHKPPVYGSKGLHLVTSSVRRFPPDCLDPKIHHNNLIQSILAKIEANVAGADDALMLDMRGFVAETNATHVFIVEGGLLRTPRLVACPEGITRAAVLDICRARAVGFEECDLTLAQVYRAEEAFCSGTMGELAPVTRVDGRVIGDGQPGPVTRRLGAWFGELHRVRGHRGGEFPGCGPLATFGASGASNRQGCQSPEGVHAPIRSNVALCVLSRRTGRDRGHQQGQRQHRRGGGSTCRGRVHRQWLHHHWIVGAGG